MGNLLQSRRLHILLLVLGCLVVAKSLVSGALYDAKARSERNIYAYQADAFVAGRFELSREVPDCAEYEGKYYAAFPPFPAVPLMPFVALWGVERVNGTLVACGLTLLNVWLLWRLLSLLNVRRDAVPWMLTAFFLGTGYWACLTTSVYAHSFAHIVAVTCMLLALNAALGRGSGLLAGLFLTCAVLSRQITLYSLAFLLVVLWNHPRNCSCARKALSTFLFMCPLAAGLGLYLFYNHARFGNPLDAGYGHVIAGGMLLAREETHGLFSPVYVPYNFIHMFLQGFHIQFKPPLNVGGIRMDDFGTSLTFASPFVFFAFWANLKRPLIWAAWISIILALTHIMFYHNNGWVQVNMQRYSLDFMPILVLLAAKATGKVRAEYWKAAVIYAFALNALALVLIPPLRHFDALLSWWQGF